MTPEGRVKELIKKWLKRHSIKYRMHVPSAYGRGTGLSDFLCMLKPYGTTLAIEAKKFGAKKDVTANQQEYLDDVNECGGVGVLVDRQEDLDELEKLLKDKGYL